MNLLAVLSSYWSTDLFSSKQQLLRVSKTRDTPPVFSSTAVTMRKPLEELGDTVRPTSLPPHPIWGNVRVCAVSLMVERTWRGVHERDGMWQRYRGARSDCEQLQRCGSVGERSCSHSCHTHTGDCQEMENCQIMFRDFAARDKLWIELWVHRQRRDRCIKMEGKWIHLDAAFVTKQQKTLIFKIQMSSCGTETDCLDS